MSVDNFKSSAQEFLERINVQLKNHNIHIQEHWDIDHVCYRTSTQEMYQSRRQEFAAFANLLIESEVNGRMISTFELHEPLHHRNRRIDLVELPAPKPGRPRPDGFEHAEVVCDLPFTKIKELYPNAKFNDSGLKKEFNQELEIELDGCAIKFHHVSLASVIRFEKNQQVFAAVKASGVLRELKDYHPLIAGTFPLGLHVMGSDIDVIVCTEDFSRLEKLIRTQWGKAPNFELAKTEVSGRPTLIANFTHGEIPFEIFAQNVPSVEQRGYRHFQVEERLLKIGGPKFIEKVRGLRAEGLKTEPAFATALDLPGDPFEELLELQVQPEYVLATQFIGH